MSDAPNFAELLAPFLGKLDDATRPAFLAGLERGAAGRYRVWAEQSPGHAEGLSACADREDEIARIADGLFPVDDSDRKAIAGLLPDATRIYMELFDGLSLERQWRLQANAERQGAAAWRGIAAQVDDASTREALERCAGLEEESAAYLDSLVA